ncbi:TonB-dependent siderophore receptor [Pantoea sp. A4]|uniref:TonB-dependent siderophore receptor n=1 Tax=Pantoea sp. A4 TaxID=1225184 RepID=UPI0003828A96|nr:TonB-dependent siderophore receptor [Pantoea sp. A4]
MKIATKYSLLASLIACNLGMSLALAADTSTESKTTKVNNDEKQQTQPLTVSDEKSSGENEMVVTAREQTLQAPGVSIIDSQAIKKHPIQRDLSEIIRTMPGVNLTGNSNSGQRGNNRQIDIRGMGPENTLIMIDGMPVSSRNSVRYGWSDERDTRGDTNWVPPEMIDRIEVIRGPAAAMYGSGAMGGVINIITKPAEKAWHGSFNTYFNAPEHKQEGATKRYNASVSGALTDNLTLRLYGNWNKTQADGENINAGHTAGRTGTYAGTLPSGREGFINKDINAVLHWEFIPRQALELGLGYSRQGNLYAGDTQNTNSNALVKANYGKETNILYRQTLSLKYTGAWDNGITTNNYIQFEKTRNTRMNEGLSGGIAGIFSSTNEGFSTINLNDTNLHSEVNIPFDLWVSQNVTFGAEFNHQTMKDPTSNTEATSGGSVPGISDTGRSKYSSADIYGVYAEDNIDLTDSTRLTPGLRYNHQSMSGGDFSPALNLSQELGNDFTLKLGIARAWKAPNLYQTNPNYLLYSKGQGCYASSGACYLQGNRDLKAETSINKEIGIEYKHEDVQAGLTWYRNDYRNKIEGGYSAVGQTTSGTDIYKWENVPKALVQGIEGTLNFPISDTVTINNNFTYNIENKNKTTGDYLSIIPKFTINSTLDWQATNDLAVQGTMTWYGKQKPKKYNYKGEPTSGSETRQVTPYVLFGASATYTINKNVDLTAGIDNLLDERHYRAGNAQTTGNATTGAYLYGAGAYTYNEPGRTYYMELGVHF